MAVQLIFLSAKPGICCSDWSLRASGKNLKIESGVADKSLRCQSKGEWALALRLLGRCKQETAHVPEADDF